MKMQSNTQNLQCGALFRLRIIVHSLHTVKSDHHLLKPQKNKFLPFFHDMDTNFEEKLLQKSTYKWSVDVPISSLTNEFSLISFLCYWDTATAGGIFDYIYKGLNTL